MLSSLNKNLTQIQPKSRISIPTFPGVVPIEVTVVARLPIGNGKLVVQEAIQHQMNHPEFVDEFNEASARIGRTHCHIDDKTGVYTFSVDQRSLVFHRHAGHRVIVAVTGKFGCLLKFSICKPEELLESAENFFANMVTVNIPGDRMFVLRFSGTIYHQFCPVDPSEDAFFAVSVHTDETEGLSGDLLQKVKNDEANIPILTEPAPQWVIDELSKKSSEHQNKIFQLDI